MLKRILTWPLILAPFLFLIVMVAKYRVDVPVWDQWALVPFLEKSLDGTLTLNDLWSQHNEHRLVFPRLAMVFLARLSRWDISYELALSLLLAAGLFGILAFCLQETFSAVAESRPWWIFPFLSLVVFSLNQVENWLWGWNIQIFLNTLSGAGMIILMTRERLRWSQVLAAAALGIIAAYSYASGLLFLIIGALLIVLSVSLPKKRRRLYFLFWCALSAAVICSYLYHYRTPPHHPSLSLDPNSLLQYVKYVLTYLGAGLFSSDVNPVMACLAGASGMLLFMLVLTMILIAKRVGPRHLLPYLALSLYALLTALLTGIGRSGFGGLQAMSPRYIAFSSLFWVSLVVLTIILLRIDKPASQRLAQPARILLGCILALIVSLTAISSFHSRLLFKERFQFLDPARKELFSLKDEELLERIYPHLREIDRREMERAVDFLRKKQLGVFRPDGQ
jgi:hypothetical protein